MYGAVVAFYEPMTERDCTPAMRKTLAVGGEVSSTYSLIPRLPPPPPLRTYSLIPRLPPPLRTSMFYELHSLGGKPGDKTTLHTPMPYLDQISFPLTGSATHEQVYLSPLSLAVLLCLQIVPLRPLSSLPLWKDTTSTREVSVTEKLHSPFRVGSYARLHL